MISAQNFVRKEIITASQLAQFRSSQSFLDLFEFIEHLSLSVKSLSIGQVLKVPRDTIIEELCKLLDTLIESVEPLDETRKGRFGDVRFRSWLKRMHNVIHYDHLDE